MKPTIKPKESLLSGFFSPKSPIEFLGFAFISVVISLLSAGNLLGLIFVPIFALLWWFLDRQRDRKRIENSGFILKKEAPQSAKGLILLLSPYDPRQKDLKEPDVLSPLIEELLNKEKPTEADFEKIYLWQSNLVPQIRAVDYHLQKGSLRDVWLISTESYAEVRGSETAAVILELYIKTLFGSEQVKIHRQGLTVREFDYQRLWRLGEDIFRQSGYSNELLLADITGGNKMMSVAIAMVCTLPGRRMQYMDSQRDWQGNPVPKGEMSPVLIDIDPILYRGNG